MTPSRSDWLPLTRALAQQYGEDARAGINAFWFVGFLPGPDDVGALRQYEHSGTRRRLILDADGRAYRQHDDLGHLSPVSLEDALVAALV